MILRRLFVLAMASFVLGLPANCQPADNGGPPGLSHHGQSPFDKLTGKNALTDDQKKQLQGLSDQLITQLQPKVAAARSKRIELMTGLTEAKLDTAKLQDLQSQMNNASNDMATLILQNQIKQMQVLTPEQRLLIREASSGGAEK